MKKTSHLILIILSTFMLMGCNIFFIEQTTNISSETETTMKEKYVPYCENTRVDGVYKCSKDFFAFDTNISMNLYIENTDDIDLDHIFDGVGAIINDYDQLLDPYESFEGLTNIHTINQSDAPVAINQELFDAIEFALNHQDVDPASEGLLFNIALWPVLDIWHQAKYSEQCTQGLLYDLCPIPSETTLSQNFNTNPSDIILDEENLTISFAKANMGIDLGGFAKGYVSMLIEEHLRSYDLNYILNLGASNVLVHGDNISNPNGDYYNIGLSTPEYDTIFSSSYGAVQAKDGYSVVTSGSYQRYFKNSIDATDETYYHHIIDPRTNYPGGDALAVSIITKDTGISDILSTAIFLMDFEDALDYVNSTPDLEAIWYFSEDRIEMSNNFNESFIRLD